jgi:hypothetical protein
MTQAILSWIKESNTQALAVELTPKGYILDDANEHNAEAPQVKYNITFGTDINIKLHK